MLLPQNHRSAFVKFRCGVAPIKIETGCYENLVVEESICPFCSNEDEMHVILDCSVYNDLRITLLDKASDMYPGFNDLTNSEKFKILLSERRLISFCAKTCCNILLRHNSLLFRYFYSYSFCLLFLQVYIVDCAILHSSVIVLIIVASFAKFCLRSFSGSLFISLYSIKDRGQTRFIKR